MENKKIYTIVYREAGSYGPVPECYSIEAFVETPEEAEAYCEKMNIEMGHDVTDPDWVYGLDEEYYWEWNEIEHLSDMAARREAWKKENKARLAAKV